MGVLELDKQNKILEAEFREILNKSCAIYYTHPDLRAKLKKELLSIQFKLLKNERAKIFNERSYNPKCKKYYKTQLLTNTNKIKQILNNLKNIDNG